MKSTIGIIELYQHNEVLIHYCKLFLIGGHELLVFCPKDMYEDLPLEIKNSKKISWQLNSEDIGLFLNEQEQKIKACDHVLVSTIFSHFEAFGKIPTLTKSTLVIHSLHTWLEPFKHINLRQKYYLKDLYRLARFYVKGQAKARRKVLQAFHNIGLANASILSYAENNITSSIKKKFRSTPFGGYIGRENKMETEKFKFTITGTIEDNVRDYYVVLDALKKIENKLDKPTQIVLLGRPKGESGIKIKRTFEALNISNLEIVTFDNYISEETYMNQLMSTDVLLVPLNPIVQYIAFEELACKSKLSGSVNDLIRYGIPSIVSSAFSVDDNIDNQLTFFGDATELGDHILKYLSQPEILDDNIYSNYAYPELYKSLKRNLNF